MSGLPTPPNEGDGKHHSSSRRSSGKNAKSSSRTSKRTTSSNSHEHGGVIIDGRHKRVWKACERCRMKKTKCDGESPCKRCKDDGLVCTAGSRKKTEFKQLPRGYAEVLENTQYALIATVQKLYAMVRNGEGWELGEPELNDRGQPVIHNIAEKLGCIRPSPDLPYAFPEDAEEFAELQAQMKLEALEDSERKSSDESVFSHPPRDHRASSSESDHSDLSKDYNQMMWSAQQKLRQQQGLPPEEQFAQNPAAEPQFGPTPLYTTEFKQEPSSLAASGAFNMRPDLSPVYTDFQAQSPMFRSDSPFSPWSGNDEFLNQGNMMDATAIYMRQQQLQAQAAFQQQRPMVTPRMATGTINPMAANTFLTGSDGTIRPGMLDGSAIGYELADQMDNIMFTNFEAPELRMS